MQDNQHRYRAFISPAAAKSRWVNEEILAFKRLGREHRVFCLIVDREPGDRSRECFPPALVYRLGVDGQLTEERSAATARSSLSQLTDWTAWSDKTLLPYLREQFAWNQAQSSQL